MELDAAAQDRERGIRRRILRTALLTTPVFIALAGAWVFFLWDRITGPSYGSTWFLVVLISLFTTLFGVQSVSALRDLFGKAREETGIVGRKWSKRDSLVFKSYYIRIERKILRGDRDVLDGIRAGDFIELRYYPHSALLVSVRKLEKPEAPEEEQEGPPKPELPAPRRPRGRAQRPEF
jgi:hypothetical protein